MRVRILRQDNPFSDAYWQEFEYQGPADNTVAGVLDDLNYRDDIVDIEGHEVRRINWECSCLQGVCGSCAMVINGRPALACETFLRDLKTKTLVLEPLKKFPTVSDLVVDRSIIEENLRTGADEMAGDESSADSSSDRTTQDHPVILKSSPDQEGKDSDKYVEKAADDEEHGFRYTAARCLKCGLCLEACPNYHQGEHFYGALFANDCYLLATGHDASASEDAARLRASYAEHFEKGCSKSLSCMTVCPMQIETIASMARLNRAGSS